jgi:hypothetical protein
MHIFSRLINMLVFNILQIPSGCIHSCSVCVAPICSPWLQVCLMLNLNVMGLFMIIRVCATSPTEQKLLFFIQNFYAISIN